MSHYPHIMARITNTPLMIAPDYLASVLRVMSARLPEALDLPSPEALSSAAYSARREVGARAVHRGIARISVEGSLTQKGGAMDGASTSMRSYAAIRADVEAALEDPAVSGLLFDIDSPGGEVAGNFALVDYLGSVRGIKPSMAIVDEHATSAAYNIAAATDRIVGPEEMIVGSIGVVLAHVSEERRLKAEGVDVTFIHAGAHKVDGNAAQALPDSVRADIQSRVNRVYGRFTATVARHRALQVEDVRATEARVYSGEDARKMGLVDEILSAHDALGDFAERLRGASRTTSTGADMAEETKGAERAEDEAPATVLRADHEREMSEVRAAAEQAIHAARLEEGARFAAVLGLDIAQASATHRTMALKYATKGMGAEEAKELLELMPVAAPAPPPIAEEGDALAAAMSRATAESEEVDVIGGEDPEAVEELGAADMLLAESRGFFTFANQKRA